MTTEQEERLIVAFESIAASLAKRLEIDHPPIVEPPEAEVYNIHDVHKEPETKEEYAIHEGGKGRYATLIENAQKAPRA